MIRGDIVEQVLASAPMRALGAMLEYAGLAIEETPILLKDLPEGLFRLMFPVTGGAVSDGAVVSVVSLFDRKRNITLYAHPMHAGPGINPLVRHVDGPMAAPKSQSGGDGARASRRIIEHKLALWDRFRKELPALGEAEAGRRWREGYYWALKRLYFCARCTACRWGSPFFEGSEPLMPPKAVVGVGDTGRVVPRGARSEEVLQTVESDAWRVEAAYAKRGGFTLSERPRLVQELDERFLEIIFPTNAILLQGGVLVAAAFTYDRETHQVVLSHCLCAGPESEIQFREGRVAFRLPLPRPGAEGERALTTYCAWRKAAWSRFWLEELERGIAVASASWLDEFWRSLEGLFGGNEVPAAPHQDVDASEILVSSSPGSSRPWELPAQAFENLGDRCFEGYATNGDREGLRACGVSTLMVNLGRRCNQACSHCHVDAGPSREEAMSREDIDHVLRALERASIPTLDITGGAPEMHPLFRYLVEEAVKIGCQVIDRCNLTILCEPGYEDLAAFLRDHRVQITASLPSTQEGVTDGQRGQGSFEKSIAALKALNALGYGGDADGPNLNLVVNPSGAEFARPQEELEEDYRRDLLERHGIVFDRLFVMNNMPIHRFRAQLEREGRHLEYVSRLVRSFNADTVEGLMCRRTLSVGWNGTLSDCDFNQVMGKPLHAGVPSHIRDFDVEILGTRKIRTGRHCFGCTAGQGSSCNGALVPGRFIAK